MSGVGCILRLLQQFFDDGSIDGLDAPCVDDMHRPPFLIPGG